MKEKQRCPPISETLPQPQSQEIAKPYGIGHYLPIPSTKMAWIPTRFRRLPFFNFTQFCQKIPTRFRRLMLNQISRLPRTKLLHSTLIEDVQINELHHRLLWCFVMEFRASPKVYKIFSLQLMCTLSPLSRNNYACRRYSKTYHFPSNLRIKLLL